MSTTNYSSEPGDGRRTVWVHEVDSENSLSTSVVFAVSMATGTDPLELDEPLSEVLDPGALDSVFRPPVDDEIEVATVSFQYQGKAVTVRSDGLIEVE